MKTLPIFHPMILGLAALAHPASRVSKLGLCSALLVLAASLPVNGATVSWVGGSGDWNTVTNWNTGVLPGANDDVVIPVGSVITVTHSAGTHTVRSLMSQQPFQLSGGSLVIASTVQVNATLTLSGGRLVGPTVLQGTNSATVIVSGNGGILDGVTVNGVLDVGYSVNGSGLTVTNGLVVNGTMQVGNPTNTWWGHVDFVGSQSLGGNATVVFGNNVTVGANVLRVVNAGTMLTLGGGVTIRGQNGQVGYSSYLGGAQNVLVVNQGTISADVSGGTVYLTAQPFSSAGLVQGLNGGNVSFTGTGWVSSGMVNVATNSALSFGGSGTNTGTLNLTNGTVNLGGTLTTAGLGVVNQSGGTVNLAGTLDNTGNGLVLGGPWVLNGGTIRNGTVVATNGASLVVNNGTLNSLSFSGVLDVGYSVNGASLTVTNGLVVNGTLLVGNPANSTWGHVDFCGSQTLGGNATVVFGNNVTVGANVLRAVNAGTVLTLGGGITVRGQNGQVGYSSYLGGAQNVSVINQGTILADVSGGTIYLTAQPFSNQGLAQAINGGALRLQNTWNSSGSLAAGTNGVLNLEGSFTGASLGTVTQAGGTINVMGVVDNTGSSLVLNGPWVLNGGRIRNGIVVATNGASLVVNGSGTLDGVTVNGVLDVGSTYNDTALTVTNGLTLNGTVLLGNPTNYPLGIINFAGSQTLGGSGAVVLGTANGSYYNNVVQLTVGGTTLTIGPGITIRGRNGVVGSGAGVYRGGPANVGLVNLGAISADVSGGTITVSAQPFSNAGLAQAVNGGTLVLNNTWSNGGQLGVSSNSVLNLNGSYTGPGLGAVNRTNGTINLTGTLDNTGNSLVLNGPWVLNGGTIRNGIVVVTNGAALVVNGSGAKLDGVTVNGSLDVGDTYDGVELTVTNGLTLNGTAHVGNGSSHYGRVTFSGSQALSGNGVVVFGSNPTVGATALRLALGGTTLTIGSGMTVRGQNGAIGYAAYFAGPQNVAVVNQGTISADVSGGTITLQGQPLTNSGTLRAAGGAVLNASVSLSLNDPGFFASQAGGTFQVHSNLLGNTRSATSYAPLGTALFNGSGSSGAPQLLEAMSQDLGVVAAGFAQNFAYETLSLANNTYVRLVDQSDNAAGAGAEAVYVNSLVVPAGCTLNLNGLHLYARASQIAGSVINGSVAQLPDSGSLLDGVPTSGGISLAGQLDEWAFAGSAGQTVLVLVDPGSASVLPPALTYAYVRLLDPLTNLLAQASNSVASQTVGLTNIVLPSTGTYLVRISAPANHATSTGNYRVTVLDTSVPVLSAQPLGQTLPLGGAASFSVTAAGSPPFSYRWQFNTTNLTDGGRITGSGSNVLAIANLATNDSGNYRVVVTNAYGSATSDVAALAVIPPPVITAQPQSQSRPFGYPVVNFGVTATSITPMTYQWIKDLTNISGATNSTYMISPMRTNDLGTYAVRVSNLGGPTLSSNAVLATDSPQATNCVPYPPGVVAWWSGEGNATNLTGINHGAFYNGATNALGIVGQCFSFDGVNDYVAVADNPLLSPHIGIAGEMTVMAWVKIQAYPSSGRPFVAKGTSGAWEYALYANPDGSVQFYLWNLAGSVSYASPSGGKVNLGQWHHVAGTLKKGQFARVYLDGVEVGEQPLVSADTGDGGSPFYIGCRGDGYYSPGLVDEVVLFSRALGSSELAAVYAAGGAGMCIPNESPPAFVLHPASQAAIEARTATFSGLALGAALPGYQWLLGGTPILNATNIPLVLTNLALSQAGDYALVASNRLGSVTSAVAQLTIIENFNLPGKSPTNCTAKPTGLIAWWPGDGTALDLAGTNHAVLQNGTYFTNGLVGQTFSFDGLDDYLDTPTSDFSSVTNTFTMAFWAMPYANRNSTAEANTGVSGAGGQRYAVWPTHGGSSGPAGVGVSVGANGISVFEHAADYLPSPLVFNTAITGWTHVAVIYLNKQPSLYLNGELVRTGLTSPRNSVFASDTFGGEVSYGLYSGLLDEIAIFNRALSANEVALIYAAGSAGMCYTNNPMPGFVQQPQSQTGYMLNSVTLTSAAMGTPRPQYQWLFNGAPLPNATNAALVLSNSGTDQTGDYAAVASNVFGTTTSAVAHLEVTLPPFVSGIESFDVGWDGWTADNGIWQVGVPTGGPGAAHAGTNVASTGPASYPADVDSRLVSPFFGVPAANQNPRLRFWHWFLTQTCCDYGQVQIRTNGGSWVAISDNVTSTFAGSGGGWTRPSIDLSRYAGQMVQLGFYFHSDPGGQAGGWFIDEVELITGPIVTVTANAPEGFEGGLGDWSADRGTWQVVVPTGGPGAAHEGTKVACTGAASYDADVDSRLVSPFFGVPAANQNPRLRFWHWFLTQTCCDYGQVQIRTNGGSWVAISDNVTSTFAGSGGWTRPSIDLSRYAGQMVQLGFYFHSDPGGQAGGWFIDDVELRSGPEIFNSPETFEVGWGDWNTDNPALWQIGVPTSGPPPNTNNFNGRAYAGTNVAACVLNGTYPASSIARLISPSFVVPSGTGGSAPVMRFWQWYQYGTGDAGLVQIAPVTNSTSWTTLAVTATNGTSTNWSVTMVDLSAYQGQQVRVGLYHTANSDGSVGPGWYLDNIEVASQSSPFITAQPQSQTVLPGTNVTLAVVASGASPLGYRWQLNNVNLADNGRITGSLSTNLAIANVATNDAGNYRVIVTNAYGSATSQVAVLTLVKGTPVLTWVNPIAITYGTALSSAQLNATASVPGSFAYSPPAGTVLNAGTHTLSVVLTPSNSVSFNNATGFVNLTVWQAPLSVTASNATRPYGQSNPTFTGRITGLQNGDFITANYASAATSASFPGTYAIVPSLADPNNRRGNYQVTLNNGTLTVTTGPAPDLRILTVSMPPDAWTGSAFDVAWVVTNAGAAVATGPWVDRVYLSATNGLNTNQDQLLGEFPFLGHLDPGQSVQLIQSVAVDRAGVTNRPYHISVWADARNNVYEGFADTNNVGISVSNINIHLTPLPDLVVASVSAPANGIGGQPVEVSWIVCNQGGADTDIPIWYDHVYLSPTTNIANAIADYGMVENPYYLAFGDCYLQSAVVTLPVGVGGAYYFIVQADSTGWLDEESKANNTGFTIVPINIQFVQPGFLHVESVQVAPSPPTTVWASGLVTVTWTVRNIGQSTISGGPLGGWDDVVALSPTPTYDFVNGYWGMLHHIFFYGSLAPGQSYTHTGQFLVPQGITAGNWYAVPIVDTHFIAGGGNIGRNQNSALVQVALPPPCDLEVTAVSGPTNAVAGQPISVRWTVANNGNNQTSSGYWYDAVYLSTNSTFSAGQSRLIGTYGHWGVLDLTSNYTQNVSVTVPADLVATNLPFETYHLFVVADAGNAVIELDKVNNVLGATNTVAIQPAPPILLSDLAVTAVEAPWTTIQGSQVLISWAVTNQGAGGTSAGAWVDNVYLSPSDKLNLATAQLLGSVAHSGILASGGTYGQSQTFNLPYCALGLNYVIVLADSGAQVNEGGVLANNVRASDQAMHIWPGNAARLEVSAVNPPANVLAGTPMTVSWTVVNSASATTTAPWVDALYLHTTPQFVVSNAYLLARYTNAANLGSGGSYTRTLSPTIPRCFSGPYYVTAVADIGNVVNSISCDTNNWRVSGTPVQVTPNGYASLQIAGITLPGTVDSGYSWNVQWTVTNAGPSAASGTWSDAVYASLSPTLDTNALLLGRFDNTGGLASGTTYTRTQAVAFPACWSGSYYIYVVADVDNHVNATACVVNDQARSIGTMAVNVGAHPDLVVSTVGIPATANAGQPMPVSWTVTNAGSATASGPWLDSVYLSPSGSGNSVFLGNLAYNGPLAAGAAYNQSTAFTLPNSTHGNFTVYVVTDNSNVVNECQGENNNVTASASVLNVPVTLYPDLHVTAVQVPASAYAGQTINVSWTVVNQGTYSTPGSTVWNDAVFLSKDQVLDPSDKRLATLPRPSSLGVGQRYTNSATVQIPAAVSGPCYVLVLADSGNTLFQYLGYNDSLGWNPSAMMVDLPATADLAATSVTLDPAAAVPGDPVNIGWNVRNVSSNSIPVTWTDAAFLSTNTVWDINAVPLARRDHSGLPASAAYSVAWTGPLPALTPGSYHAVVRTDVRNTVRETNLVNNTAISTNTIAVDVPELVLGQPTNNQLTTGSAQYYKLKTSAGETVRIILTGASTNSFNELFVRYGSIPDLGSYDFLYSTPFAPNQQIDIPTTQAGWYYVMVRGGNEPGGTLGYTLRADIVPFAISSVSANHIGDNGQVTITVKGAKFQAGATVQLVSGTNIYAATTNFFTDATSVKARFMFTNAVQGIYDVVLTNPNSQSTTATQAVIVDAVTPLSIVTTIAGNTSPRAGQSPEFTCLFKNTANVDAPYVLVRASVDTSSTWTLSKPEIAYPRSCRTCSTNSEYSITGHQDADAGGFVVRDFEVGQEMSFSITLHNISTKSLVTFAALAETREDFVSQMMQDYQDLRAGLLEDPSIDKPEILGSIVATPEGWWSAISTNLVLMGLIDNLQQPDLPRAGAGNAIPATVSKSASCEDICKIAIRTICAKHTISRWKVIWECFWKRFASAKCEVPCAGTVLGGGPECLGCIGACLVLCTVEDVIFEVICHQVSEKTCKLICEGIDCMKEAISRGDLAGAAACIHLPRDPNEMQGPTGYSASAFVGSQVPWQYTVFFENTSNALAFARQIIITNALDPSFDVRTFRVSEIAFGNVTITVPANRSFYQTRIAAPYPNPTNIVVDVSAGIDAQHGVVSLTLNAIDLNTGQLVENADLGVLPPNTTNHIGEGHITYTIKPKSSVPTGTVVTNQASIVFDTNDPINTNPTTNTVDALPPTSWMAALPSAVLTTNFTVSWFGTDDTGGSGVGSYDIYVSDNGGPWQPWQTAISDTSATYGGQPGHYYYFYSIAHDNAGNLQPVPGGYEAMTLVSTNQAPVLPPIADRTIIVGTGMSLTNVAGDVNGAQNLSFSLQNAPAGASINPTNGYFSWNPGCAQGSTTNLITIWATDNGLPPLSNSVTFAVVVGECVQVSIGSTVMQIGTTSSVPVNLLSTVALTNLSFTLSYPSNRFANWTASASNTAIATFTAQAVDPTDAFFTLRTVNGQVLQGPALAGTVVFSAPSNSSAFVPLAIGNIQGTKADGSPVGNTFGLGGRVVVIGNQPLLEASLGTNAQRLLRVYGNPGEAYQVNLNTNLAKTNWLYGWHFPQTNLAQDYSANQQLPVVFYRAQKLSADPPILELSSAIGSNMTLLLYGMKGTNYLLQANTNLGLTNGWFTATNFTLTNSFRYLETGKLTNKAEFFRAKRP